MKVCTDSCLFGAWIADKIQKNKITPTSMLDVGAGTGLLSLMIAQKKNIHIDALEIDKNSFNQTKENFNASPWQQHLSAVHTDVKKWNNYSKYDLIISNPPFYENDLKANLPNKNIARHDDGLTLAELIQSIKNNLSHNGKFAVLLPFHRVQFFKEQAVKDHFFLEKELLIKQTPKHSWFRGILLFGTKAVTSKSSELIIKDGEGNYTKEFDSLLKDYYL